MGELRQEIDNIIAANPTVVALRRVADAVEQLERDFGGLARRVGELSRRLDEYKVPEARKPRQKKLRGVFCRGCNKRLDGKYQTVFHDRACAVRWHAKHPGEIATPKMVEHEKEFSHGGATVVAGEGLRK